MAEVRVVCDSSCDLPRALIDELGIGIVPLTVRFGDEELVDREDLTPEQFWARCRTSAVLPETAAPSPGAFEQMFRGMAEDGATGVVCITISSVLSATEQAARVGAEALAGELAVRVIDSRSVSLGHGMIALAAARQAADGAALDDVVRAATHRVARTRVYAALDTLENLRKGGRLSAAQALVGSMLSFKPILEVRDGKVDVESKQRTRGRALRYLAEKVRAHGPVESLAVPHGDAPDVDTLLDLLDGIHPRQEIVVGDLGAVIGAHAGPRTIGVAFSMAG